MLSCLHSTAADDPDVTDEARGSEQAGDTKWALFDVAIGAVVEGDTGKCADNLSLSAVLFELRTPVVAAR